MVLSRYLHLWLLGGFIISCVEVRLIMTHHSTCPSDDREQVIEESYCMPWHYRRNKTEPDPGEECMEFGDSYHEIVRKDNGTTLLQLGYCMTYHNNSTHLAACPYDVVGGDTHADMLVAQMLGLNVDLAGLNNFTCGYLNRKDKHCANCLPGHGQSVYTLDLKCYNCSGPYRGWALYLFLELASATVFLVAVLLIQVSPTKANMKAFVMYSQLITILLSLSYEQPYKYIYGSKGAAFTGVLKSAYGIWNLDFFRGLLPPFCVSDDLNNLEVVAFQYFSIFYLTMLVALAWMVVELHERGCKLVVRMWKPFRSYLSHYSVTTNPKATIMSALATLVTLAYTKVLYVSANLLNEVYEYGVCSKTGRVLFLQPDVRYFHQPHLPFVALATLMLCTYVVAPLVVLLLYPLNCVQERLKSFWTRHSNVQMFAEAFYRPYHDGSNDTRDCRLFCTFYLFLRIFLVLIFVKSWLTIISYILGAVLHGIVVGLFVAFKPYKNEAYNYLDGFFSFVFGVALLFSAFATNNIKNVVTSRIFFSGIFLVMLTPLLYASIRVMVMLVRMLKMANLQAFFQRRRRGYVEIGVYVTDNEASMSDADQHQQQHQHQQQYQGAREKDSFSE